MSADKLPQQQSCAHNEVQQSCAPIVHMETNAEKFINRHAMAPQWSFRLLICGQTGCGKTNLLLNLLLNYLYYNKLYVYAKDLSESSYIYLQEFFDDVHRKVEEDYNCIESIATFSSNKADIVDVDDLDKEYQNLIVFDDFVTEKDQDSIIELFTRGRKKNVSVIYLTQSYYSTPKDIRLQCNYFMFFNIGSKREIIEIEKDHTIGLTKEEFLHLFKLATEDPYSFMTIDLKTKEKRNKFRKNLDYRIGIVYE